jgi:hypothetical protein
MACDVCGVDYGYHQGKCSIDCRAWCVIRCVHCRSNMLC